MVKKTPKKSKPAILLYADSENSADMLYFSQFFVPDPFIALKIGKKKIGVFGALEFARAHKESSFDKILPLESYWSQKTGILGAIVKIAKEHGVGHFEIPYDFPAGLAFQLKKKGLSLDPIQDLFPARALKTPEQAKAIQKGNAASAAGIQAAETALKASVIKSGKLYLKGKPLTSERLRELINIACLEAGAVASNTIAAGGNQACDPHCVGSGPLRAHELIIVDVFPRISATGYHGDMTRTFLKGKASDAQKKLVKTVQDGQKRGLKLVKAGVVAKKIHHEITKFFDSQGLRTQKKGDGYEGFFHGTGHGLGLEVHEGPHVGSMATNKLKKGHVITIEPGLYYPGLGGCRIEDVVWVQEKSYKMLSKYHYRWQLR